ncbi:MAG: hypothetical protein OXN92_08015 [Gammaproteobacteria bacterium]|nr:hypothetical protein [Gammaproteobacteria bacterium]
MSQETIRPEDVRRAMRGAYEAGFKAATVAAIVEIGGLLQKVLGWPDRLTFRMAIDGSSFRIADPEQDGREFAVDVRALMKEPAYRELYRMLVGGEGDLVTEVPDPFRSESARGGLEA